VPGVSASVAPAPVVLFAYARPDHLARTLAALRRNRLAAETVLYVYSDAAKDARHQPGVAAVRALVRDITGFAAVHCIEREHNFGLARSVIEGVTSVLGHAEQVIVLEDDLEVSEHFLEYMNAALALYADDEQVASVHGYIYPVGQALPESFFLRGADCWGWATWRRAWAHFNPDGQQLLEQLERRGLTHAFDLDGAYPYTRMLRHQIAGRNNSWAIRWHAACFLKDMLTLYPGCSLVRNIGNDDSGTHSATNRDFDVELADRPLPLRRLPLAASPEGTRAVRDYFRRTRWLPRRLLRHAHARLVRLRNNWARG
jgi:hypothetical protein